MSGIKLSIFTTVTTPVLRGDNLASAFSCYQELADEVIVVDGSPKDLRGTSHGKLKYVYSDWPPEFDWPLIGQQFQKGYEAATGDWVIHADIDFIFHEKDFENIRKSMEVHNDAPALSFLKWQFILPDRYNLKSRLVIAVNKAKFGDRIRFDSGGDLCQPSLDGQEIKPDYTHESGVEFYNYEKMRKNLDQVMDDAGRMARAWRRHFGNHKLGGDDDESAFEEWAKMMKGRFTRPSREVELSAHPKFIQDEIRALRPEQFGYEGFGMLPKNNYVRNPFERRDGSLQNV